MRICELGEDLDEEGVVAKAVDMAIKRRRLTGTVVSRRGIYAKAPPEAIYELLNA